MAFTKVTNVGIASTGTVLLQDVNATGIVTAGLGVSTVDGFFSGVTTTSTLKSTGVLSVTNTTESTSTTTGAVIISGGVGIAKTLHVGGSVSIGGTLTYEDVTNVDSVGLITARSGVYVSGGTIKVGTGITLSTDGDGYYTGVVTATTFSGTFAGDITGAATQITVADESSDTSAFVVFTNTATGNNAPKTGSNLTFNSNTGALTATSFAGDGSALTGLQAGKFVSDSLGITTNTAIGIETSSVADTRIAGAASSFRGMWIGDGYIGFPTTLDNSGGYYISTFTNALNAGPLTLSTTMTLDGTWVIV